MKWGFKIIARCGLTGFVYDFHVDGDSYLTQEDSIRATGDIVLHLCSSLPADRQIFVYMDRFYTSLNLERCSKQETFFTVGTDIYRGTTMSNRLFVAAH